MPITQRGNIYEVAIHYHKERFRRSFKTYKDAEIWEAQSKADLVASRLPEMETQSNTQRRPRTLQELADYTYKHHWAGMRSERKTWVNAMKVVGSIGGSTDITAIDKFIIDEMMADFKSIGNKSSTINRKLAALSRMLRTAEELKVISEKPAISYLKEPQERIRWYTDEEQQRILNAFKEFQWVDYGMVVRVLLDTGMRSGELLGLEWENIQGNLIVLDKTKNFSARSIPMTPDVQRIMEYMSEIPTGPFKWTNYDLCKARWNAVRKHLGWQDDEQACLHACRHTFITNLVQENTNLFMVQQLAGHKSLAMTKRYTHLAPNDLEDVIKRLARRRGSPA
jgi:integrase